MTPSVFQIRQAVREGFLDPNEAVLYLLSQSWSDYAAHLIIGIQPSPIGELREAYATGKIDLPTFEAKLDEILNARA